MPSTLSFHASLSALTNATSAIATNLPPNLTPETIAFGITTDSRAVVPGQIFVALRGETFDGHDYVARAIAAGAVAAVVDDTFEAGDLPVLVVRDTLKAYQAIGRWWRRQFDIPVIAITGSVGKTTTKELIAKMLVQFGPVLKTQANFNNEIGVPKTLLELNAEHQFAVVEMGMRGPGQIAELALIAEPTIGLITTVGTSHIELLGSRMAIAQAKCELLTEMPSSGIAIYNADQPLLVTTAQQCWPGKTISYGFTAGELQGHLDGDRLVIDGTAFPLPLPGEHNAINYLGAFAVLKALELDISRFTAGIEVSLPSGRAKRYELTTDGVPNDIVILDETYNAGLESMLASLTLLSQTPGTRRLAVLGTMKELGEFSIAFHEQVGDRVQELGFDRLLILAEPAEAEALAHHAEPVPSERFFTYESLVDRLNELMQPGDRILVKASRSVGLDRVVNALLESQLKSS